MLVLRPALIHAACARMVRSPFVQRDAGSFRPAVLALLSGLMLVSPARAETREVAPTGEPITSLSRLASLQAFGAPTPPAMTGHLPAVQDWHTRGGLRTLFVAASQLPMVDIRLTFDAGSARDASMGTDRSGLASLVASMLDEGTSTQDTDAIASHFEALGAQYSASAYRDMFAVELRALSDPAVLQPAVTQLLELLADAQFPSSSLERIRASTAIGQQQREESPASMASIRFWRELYGTHPYAEPSTGTQASLSRISREDLLAFKARYLVRGNASLAITGQLTPSQAQQLAEQISRALPSGPAAPALPQPVPVSQARTVQIPYESSQAQVILGQLGVDRQAADLPALLLANELVGGGDFNALLMKELRQKRGLTYGAYSSYVPMRVAGPFSVSFSTRSDQAQQAVQLAQQTLSTALEQGFTEAQFVEAQEGLLNSYPLGLASNENINAMLGMMGFYGLPSTYLADYPRRLQAVTRSDAQSALRRHLDPARLLTIVVGPVTTPSPATPATPVPISPETAPASQPDPAPTTAPSSDTGTPP